MQNKANLNLNLSQTQQTNAMNLNNTNTNLNSMHNNNTNNLALMASLNSNVSNNNTNNNNNNANTINQLNNSATPQIQNQLIESFKLAVQSGLISADLLNTKLPQDVLTLLYQLFQTLAHFKTSNNKKEALNLRRAQLLPAQFKSEMDIINQEIATYKENLINLQAKINNAHAIIKQQQQQQAGLNNSSTNIKLNSQMSGSQTPISSASSSLVTTPPSSSSSSTIVSGLSNLNLNSNHDPNRASVEISVQLNDLPINNRSKFLQLISDNNNSVNSNKNQLNRQGSNQQMIQQQQQAKLQPSNSPGNFMQNFPTNNNNNWPNYKMSDSNNFMDQSSQQQQQQLDDRITPFIPGQLWAGAGQSSIEDDPNCTPGSVSKPLLTETIDPETILTSLSRNNHWSNSLTDNSLLNSSLNSNNNMIGGGGLGNNTGMMNQMNNNNNNQRRPGTGNGIANNTIIIATLGLHPMVILIITLSYHYKINH